MSKYSIGIDAHVKFCQFGVVDTKGRKLLNTPVNTVPKDLINFAKRFPGAKAMIESSTLSTWLVRTLEPYFEEIVVCDPRQNKWISASDDSSDAIDAYKLAQLLRGGFYNEVHVPIQSHQLFREIVFDYHRLTKESTRFKNHIKAKFRSRGVDTPGQTVFGSTARDNWLAMLDPRLRESLQPYYRTLDHLLGERDLIVGRLRTLSKQFSDIALMQTAPGVGIITSATFYALIDNPWRFAGRHKLWSYCRLGLKNKTSAGRKKGGGQKGGSRVLKSVLMNAAQVAIHRCNEDNRFSKMYRRNLARGLSAKIARRTVARNLCCTLWSMWKSGQPYHEIETSVIE